MRSGWFHNFNRNSFRHENGRWWKRQTNFPSPSVVSGAGGGGSNHRILGWGAIFGSVVAVAFTYTVSATQRQRDGSGSSNNPTNTASSSSSSTTTTTTTTTATTTTTSSSSTPPIFRVVLTGGPCGGKSTALSRIQEHFNSLGFRVYCVPEVATLLFSAGFTLGNTQEQLYTFEYNHILTQMALEDRFFAIAQATGQPSLILCDRGVLDTSAYVSPSLWKILLEDGGWTQVQLRDQRYDGVIHMVTAALGAEKFYTTENNPSRKENIPVAIELDRKVLSSWLGHPRLRVVDNSTSFDEKVQKVVGCICELIGAPVPGGSERRFLVQPPGKHSIPLKSENFNVESSFLISNDKNKIIRLKRREQHQVSAYSYSFQNKGGGGIIEYEKVLTAKEYRRFMQELDTTKCVVKKRQTCFLWEGRMWVLNHYTSPKDFWILETHELNESTITTTATKTSQQQQQQQQQPSPLPPPKFKLPPFLTVEREVTQEVQYTGIGVALENSSSTTTEVQ